MSENNQNRTYRYCAVQLNIFSLLLVNSLTGFCGGLSFAFIFSISNFIGIVNPEKFDNYIVNFIGFSFLGLLFGVLFSIVGYPLYTWVCKNIKGQKLSGIFHNPHD